MRKPPMGLTPHSLWKEKIIEERIKEIHEAIDRYSKVGLPYPTKWYTELHALQFCLDNSRGQYESNL